jgi:PAP2 superfamily
LSASYPDSVGGSLGSPGTPSSATALDDAPSPSAVSRLARLRGQRWWREIVLIAGFYAVYSAIRDLHGSRPVSVNQAFHNARRVIGFERWLGVFHEAQVQHAVLHDRGLIRLLDDWYGSTHFVVTAGVLAILFFAYPERYRLWRNTLAVATAAALLGFAFFPLMPPRLLPSSFGFTDTLRVVGGLWNFNSGPIDHLSDQYAAMPSLHFAWALWCGLALFSVAGRLGLRLAALCYPAVTLICVIVTANHYFTDTAAGAAIVGVGYLAARGIETRRREARAVTAGGSR